jgi:hypothetical protein
MNTLFGCLDASQVFVFHTKSLTSKSKVWMCEHPKGVFHTNVLISKLTCVHPIFLAFKGFRDTKSLLDRRLSSIQACNRMAKCLDVWMLRRSLTSKRCVSHKCVNMFGCIHIQIGCDCIQVQIQSLDVLTSNLDVITSKSKSCVSHKCVNIQNIARVPIAAYASSNLFEIQVK